MQDKASFILHSIIKNYLQGLNPVGSGLLEEDLKVPASTIRVYFKKLDDAGLVSKLHISGGRVPTIKAMQAYWQELLGELATLKVDLSDFEQLKDLVLKLGLCSIVFEQKDLHLKDVHELNRRFIVLEMEEDELAIAFLPELFTLLEQLVGLDLRDIRVFAHRLGIKELAKKIDDFLDSLVLFYEGEAQALELFSSMKRYFRLNDSLDLGLSFAGEDLRLKLGGNYEGKDACAVFAGSIYSDFYQLAQSLDKKKDDSENR